MKATTKYQQSKTCECEEVRYCFYCIRLLDNQVNQYEIN